MKTIKEGYFPSSERNRKIRDKMFATKTKNVAEFGYAVCYPVVSHHTGCHMRIPQALTASRHQQLGEPAGNFQKREQS